jgi:hypothetical protein
MFSRYNPTPPKGRLQNANYRIGGREISIGRCRDGGPIGRVGGEALWVLDVVLVVVFVTVVFVTVLLVVVFITVLLVAVVVTELLVDEFEPNTVPEAVGDV